MNEPDEIIPIKRKRGRSGLLIFVLLVSTCTAIVVVNSDPPPAKLSQAEVIVTQAPASALAPEPQPKPGLSDAKPDDVIKETETLRTYPTVGSDVLDAAGRRAEAEARRYLIKCQMPPDEQMLCRIQQANFVEMYVYAKAGDVTAMGSTASSFQPPWSGALDKDFVRLLRVGMPVSPLQSCAWLIVKAQSPLTPDERRLPAWINQTVMEERARHANVICGRLPAADQTAARRRAEVLLQELSTARPKMPPIGWDPEHKGKPIMPDPGRILDSTLAPRIPD